MSSASDCPVPAEHERRARRIPIQLEAFRMRRDPDLAHRRVRTHHELARRRLKLDGQRAGVEVDLELVVLGSGGEPPVEIVQRLFRAGLEFLFVHSLSVRRFAVKIPSTAATSASVSRHATDDALAFTCSGVLAPAMTEAITRLRRQPRHRQLQQRVPARFREAAKLFHQREVLFGENLGTESVLAAARFRETAGPCDTFPSAVHWPAGKTAETPSPDAGTRAEPRLPARDGAGCSCFAR